MSDVSLGEAPESRHLEAAAEWFVRLSDGGAHAQLAWQAWYDAAPEHRAAWARVEKLQGLLAAAPSQTRVTLETAGRRSRRRFMAACGFAVLAGSLYLALPHAPAQAPIEWISTRSGERRELGLPDGGSLLLGAGTRVGIAYGPDSRDIYLSAGAIRLRSGRDARQRPLRILARDGVVTPLGTRFTLVQEDDRSLLAVQEHAVLLRLPDGHPDARVEAGQRVIFSSRAATPPEPADWADEAWTRGLLVVIDMPLAQFAERFSQQSGQRIAVEPALGALRVSGSYQVDAPGRSLTTLAEAMSLRLQRTSEGWRLGAR